MFCEKCGSKIKDEHMFCTACGAKRSEMKAEKTKVSVAVKPNPRAVSAEVPVTAASQVFTKTEQPVESAVKVLPISETPVEPTVTAKPISEEAVEPVAATANVTYIPQQKKAEKRKLSGGKLALIISAAVLGLIIVVAGVLMVLYFTSSEQQIVRALDNADYDKALSIYDERFDGDSTELLEQSMISKIEKIKQDYIDENIEYKVAYTELVTIEKMNIASLSELVDEAKEYICGIYESRYSFDAAESWLEKGNYLEAIDGYRRVVDYDPNYETAKTNLAKAIESYREEILATAAEYADEGLFEKAMSELESALEVISEDEALAEQLEVYKVDYSAQLKEKALVQAEGYAENKEYDKAIVSIRDAIESIDEDVKLTSALDTYTTAYVDAVVNNVDASIKSKDFTKAVSVLNDALEILPDNEELSAKLAIVEENMPVLLSSLTEINGGWVWNDGDPTDPFGVTYSDASNFAIIEGNKRGEEYYAEYRLYGDYKMISGSMISHADITETGYSQLKIYSDDKLVYTSPKIGRKTDLLDFSVDVSGAEYIKLVVFSSNEESFWSDTFINCLILMDCQLWKE